LIDITSIGGNLGVNCGSFELTNNALGSFKNNLFESTQVLQGVAINNNKLITNEVIKVLLYLWETKVLASSGLLITNNQTPIAPLGNDIGINTFINKLTNLGWSITTD
jgi:hypothetical protein